MDRWRLNEGSGTTLYSDGAWGTQLEAHPTYGPNWILTPAGYGLEFNGDSLFTSSAGWGSSLTQITMAAWVWVNDGAESQTLQYLFTAGDADAAIILNRDYFGVRDLYIHDALVTPEPYVLPRGEWVHVVFVAYGEGTGLGSDPMEYIYVNGVEQQSRRSRWSKPTPANRAITFGEKLGNWFYGRMDELSFYDTAMTQAEVEALYLAGPEPADFGLPVVAPVDQWLFNEGAGGTLNSSGTWGTPLTVHAPFGPYWIVTPGGYGLDFTSHSMFESAAGWGDSFTQITMTAWMWVNDGAESQTLQYAFTAGDADAAIILNKDYFGVRDLYIHSGMMTPEPYVLPRGEWVHVAFVAYGEGNGGAGDPMEYLYVNGVVQQSRNSVWTKPTPGNRKISLGIALTGSDWFYGRMDELAFYDSALADTEIIALYLAGPATAVAVPETELVEQWLFNEGSGAVAGSDGSWATPLVLEKGTPQWVGTPGGSGIQFGADGVDSGPVFVSAAGWGRKPYTGDRDGLDMGRRRCAIGDAATVVYRRRCRRKFYSQQIDQWL